MAEDIRTPTKLKHLDRGTCLELLAADQVGRIAVTGRRVIAG